MVCSFSVSVWHFKKAVKSVEDFRGLSEKTTPEWWPPRSCICMALKSKGGRSGGLQGSSKQGLTCRANRDIGFKWHILLWAVNPRIGICCRWCFRAGLLYMHVYIYIYSFSVYVCRCMCTKISTCAGQRSTSRVGFPLPPSGSLWTQAVGLGSRCLYPLSHLAILIFDFFFKAKC